MTLVPGRRIPTAALQVVVQEAILRAEELRRLQGSVDDWHNERDDLKSYMPAVHRTDAGDPAVPVEHIRTFLDVIADDSLGHTLIIAPPGSAKTLSCIAAAGWRLGKNPNLHVGYLSETASQAAARSLAIRDTITNNPDYRAIFPEAQRDPTKKWTESEWFLWRVDQGDKDASMRATGAGGPIQGARLDLIFLDDIASLKNMATPEQRAKLLTWLNQVVKSRLTPQGRMIMICTRWHTEDPAGWAIKEGWRVVRIKAVDEDEEGHKRSYWPARWPLHRLDCIAAGAEDHGQGDPTWEPSEERPQPPCWVERDADGNVLQMGRCLRSGMSQREWNLTYQGDTTDDTSAIWKRANWRFRSPAIPFPATRGALFVDLAHEEHTAADFTSIARWLTNERDFFLSHQWRYRWEFPEVLDFLRALVKAELPDHQWPTRPEVLEALRRLGRTKPRGPEPAARPPFPGMSLVVENTPGSRALIQTLRREVPGVIAWKIQSRYGGSKLGRANSVVHLHESHNIYLPEGAPWVGEYIEELAAFRGDDSDSHDDQVDTTTMALLRFTGGGLMQTLS